MLERHEFIFVGIVMLFVIGPVLLLAPLIAWHYRLANTHSAYRPQWGFTWLLEGLIWIPPTLIVIGLAVFLWRDTAPARPLSAAAACHWHADRDRGRGAGLEVAVHLSGPGRGHGQPAGHPGRPARASCLTSATVMQSILMPQPGRADLRHGRDADPAEFLANAPGSFRGENVQFNGDGFQNQKFQVNALTPGTSRIGWRNPEAEPNTAG